LPRRDQRVANDARAQKVGCVRKHAKEFRACVSDDRCTYGGKIRCAFSTNVKKNDATRFSAKSD
jgi:hypothetical protein